VPATGGSSGGRGHQQVRGAVRGAFVDDHELDLVNSIVGLEHLVDGRSTVSRSLKTA
jgi:hypothetical protein